MSKHADKYWRDQVMTVINGGLWPRTKEELYSRVAEDVNLPLWPKQEYIDKAINQLRDEGTICYFRDWQGWQVPDFPGLYAEEQRQHHREFEAEIEATHRRSDERAKEHDARMLDYWRENVRLSESLGLKPPPRPEPTALHFPDDSRRKELIGKLQAKADSTEYPEEEASLRAKIKELEGR